MTTSVKPDSLFQIFIKDFAEDFGIENPAELETQRREIIPQSVQIDTVVSFADDFDFTKLQDRIFPFWGKENVIEYKAENDKLTPRHVYKYALTELGVLTTHFLSEEQEERKERQSLSQRASKAQRQRLKAQGALHTCCNTILSTIDPVGIRKGCKFEAVETYEHLTGALYRLTIVDDDFAGSLATYLVVLNALPVHPRNAPLLLLSTGKKLDEFCEWLLEAQEGIEIKEQQYYLLYLAGHNLVRNREVLRKMRRRIGNQNQNDYYMIELMAEDHEDDRIEFFQNISKIVWQTDSPIEAAQKMLQADSPRGVAQKALQADSPAEAALELIQSEEEMERLLELIRQRNNKQ